MSEDSSENQAIEVFFSYAHEDEKLRDELAKHLSLLEEQGFIKAWYDRDISAGTEWDTKINEHLNTADLILLLVSADFLASKYIRSVELRRAMERHEAKEARVIPVILRPVDWRGAQFGQLQALPKNALPITTWSNQDEAFLDVARRIRQVVEELKVVEELPELKGLGSGSKCGEKIQSRRFEAAMPKKSKVGQKTEVRVMVALPDSLGLRDYLPDWTKTGDLIAKKDVVQNKFPLEFPEHPATHELLSTNVFVALTAPDFKLKQAIKSLYISPKQDSGVVTFFLTPNVPQKYGRVIVELFKDEQRTILLSSLMLMTEIRTQQYDLGQVVWQVVTLPLRVVSRKNGAVAVTPNLQLEQLKMPINGSQRKQLLQAIISAYPSKADLEMMIDFGLEENLNIIAGGENYQQVVYNLIKWAKANGKLDKLIGAACNNNPGNEKLKDIKQKLVPSKEVDYTRLRDLLAAWKWQEADQETARILLELADRQESGWLRSQDIEQIHCSDLHTIDQIWTEYSGSRFGFSVQKRIWNEVGGQPGQFDFAIFLKFGARVGWRVNKDWCQKYDDFIFASDAPEGHLPSLRFPGAENEPHCWKTWKESFQSLLKLFPESI